ncbi:hypothetical protein HNY73_009183 [Argiope bruennichi]|uniref:Uncharacterized protein n=1 Tax=Argiope bruennichi TaxID=94029 RepID=A0A8T0FFA3_ARGBR|nr:hypothetical protein HNY73_009183 [Argiope bruennichi]
MTSRTDSVPPTPDLEVAMPRETRGILHPRDIDGRARRSTTSLMDTDSEPLLRPTNLEPPAMCSSCRPLSAPPLTAGPVAPQLFQPT